MWVPKAVVDWFKISKDSVDELRNSLAVATMERDLLRAQLAIVQTNFDWLRMKVNSLELERTALMEKAYNIKLPVPEILRQPVMDPAYDPKNFSFDDIGEEMARKFGMPTYDESK